MNIFSYTSYLYLQILLLSFVFSFIIAVVYVLTFRGFSYSRPFVQSIVLSSLVTTMAMISIEGSMARGLGMMGALTMIRFRSSVKDPKDMIFIFASIAIGIACSVQKFDLALLGTIVFCIIAILINNVSLGKNTYYDGLIRIQSDSDKDILTKINNVLANESNRFSLVSLREIAQGNKYDYSYQVKLKNKVNQANLISSIKKIGKIDNVTFLIQQTNLEI
jgi:uncharacterized membrane protein YhiD involved in acid resistance